MKNAVEYLKEIDFGDIDGLYEKRIMEFFYDEGFWEKIVEKDIYFVIGRKGTGKSAIYNWIKKMEGEKGALRSNLSF